MHEKNARKAVTKKSTASVTKTKEFSDLEVLTKSEACSFLKCGMSTLPKLGLPVIRMGRSVKYLKRDLETFLISARQGGSNE